MSTAEDTKTVVDAYYQAGVEDNLPGFAPHLATDFSVTAPNYLPWGGTHVGSAFFAENVLHHLPETLDFARLSYDSFIAEGSHAVALITIGVTGRLTQSRSPSTGSQRRFGPIDLTKTERIGARLQPASDS